MRSEEETADGYVRSRLISSSIRIAWDRGGGGGALKGGGKGMQASASHCRVGEGGGRIPSFEENGMEITPLSLFSLIARAAVGCGLLAWVTGSGVCVA